MDCSKFFEAFSDFDIGDFHVNEINLSKLETFADRLISTKDRLAYKFIQKLLERSQIKTFEENSDLKNFRRLEKMIPKDINIEDLGDLYTFAYNIGCFSKNLSLNQKANGWLETMVVKKPVKHTNSREGSTVIVKSDLPFYSMHSNFESWKPEGDNEEFSNFLFGKNAEKKTSLFEEIQSDENWGQFLGRVYEEFSNSEKDLTEGGRFRDKESGRLMFAVFNSSVNEQGQDTSKRKDLKPTVALFKEYFASKKFIGVTTADDKAIAEELSKWNGMQQKHFDRA